MGTTANVRVGPGTLKIAPLGTAEPTDLATAWNAAWVDMGYTAEGSEFTFDNTYEDVDVAEELEAIAILQTARQIMASFECAELTADNLEIAFNGGTVTTGVSTTEFEPPDAGNPTYVMLGWESDDALERWIFRKGLQVGSTTIARRKAPDKATIPMEFRFVKPAAGTPAFKFIHDTNYAA